MGLFKSREEKRLIELQNIIYNTNSSRLLREPGQILDDAQTYVSIQSNVLDRATESMASAENPGALFRDVDDLRLAVSRIRRIGALYPEFGFQVEADLDSVENILEDTLPPGLDELMDIWWEKAKAEASLCDYESDRYKRMKLFFEEMDAYADRLYPQNRLHLERLRKTSI